MKKITIILLTLTFLSLASYSQSPPARTWYFNNYGKKTTVKERWFEDSDGLKHGKYIGYYSNAERQISGSYNHGKKNGKWIEEQCYDVLFSEICHTTIITYKNNVKHGPYKSMIKNTDMLNAVLTGGQVDEYDGSFNTIGQYTNGKRTGYWKESFNDEEKVYQEGNYSTEGKPVGKWTNTALDRESFTTKKGYTSFFSNAGDFVSCTNPEGIDVLEEEAFKNGDYAEFISKYPNSIYVEEARVNLKREKEQERQKNELAELEKRSFEGDIEAINTLYPDDPIFEDIYYIANNRSNEIFENTKLKSTSLSARWMDSEEFTKLKVVKGILNNSKNSFVKTSYQYYAKEYGKDLYSFSLSVQNDLCTIEFGKKPGETGGRPIYIDKNGYSYSSISDAYFVYKDNDEIISMYSNKIFTGFWDKTSEEQFGINLCYLKFGLRDIRLSDFQNAMLTLSAIEGEQKTELYNILIDNILTKKSQIVETKKNDESSMRSVYLSILYWEINEPDKAISVLKNENLRYKKWSPFAEQWVDCSAGDYIKFLIKKYLNEEKSIELVNQKDYLKLIKKE